MSLGRWPFTSSEHVRSRWTPVPKGGTSTGAGPGRVWRDWGQNFWGRDDWRRGGDSAWMAGRPGVREVSRQGCGLRSQDEVEVGRGVGGAPAVRWVGPGWPHLPRPGGMPKPRGGCLLS